MENIDKCLDTMYMLALYLLCFTQDQNQLFMLLIDLKHAYHKFMLNTFLSCHRMSTLQMFLHMVCGSLWEGSEIF